MKTKECRQTLWGACSKESIRVMKHHFSKESRFADDIRLPCFTLEQSSDGELIAKGSDIYDLGRK